MHIVGWAWTASGRFSRNSKHGRWRLTFRSILRRRRNRNWARNYSQCGLIAFSSKHHKDILMKKTRGFLIAWGSKHFDWPTEISWPIISVERQPHPCVSAWAVRFAVRTSHTKKRSTRMHHIKFIQNVTVRNAQAFELRSVLKMTKLTGPEK